MAPSRTPPSPAVGRDPSEGGLGLYLIAELASDHGWYVTAGAKHVWAVLAPTTPSAHTSAPRPRAVPGL